MAVLDILVTTVSAGLGLMLTGFAGLNLVGEFVGGTFFNKFIFEMDRVMGGQLGIPHYSKVEFCMLALGAAGAWTSVFSDSTDPSRQLLPIVGFISAAAYMFICSVYAAVTGGSPVAPFAVIGGVASGLAKHRMDTALDDPEDKGTASTFLLVMAGAVLMSAVVMKLRDTEERRAFNRRFVRINKFCEKNKDFVWKDGKDAPEGFE